METFPYIAEITKELNIKPGNSNCNKKLTDRLNGSCYIALTQTTQNIPFPIVPSLPLTC
jgi:hypothetical protein